MPHPDNLVQFEVTEDLAATPRDTMQEVALLGGYAPAEVAPDAGYLNLSTYSDPTQVSNDFGEDSDVHEAAKQFFRTGAQSVRALAFELSEFTEVTGDTTATSSMQLSNVPVTGLADVTVTVDGDPAEVVDVISSPPDLTEAETRADDPTGLLAALNRDTGEIETSTATSGAGAGIEAQYSRVPWTEVFEVLDQRSLNFIDLANHLYGYESIGDIDELVPWQDANQVARIQAYPNGQQYDRPDEGLSLAQDVGNYAPSGSWLPISHESPDSAIAAYGLGLYATNDAGFNIFQHEYPVSIPTNSQYERLIGDPGADGTFEGGAAGSGPSNVIVDDQGTNRISNSLSGAGISDDRRYLDRTRRIWYLETRAEQSVKERVQPPGGRFDRSTQVQIEEAIEEEFRNDTGDGEMFTSVEYDVPDPEDTARADRSNRFWAGTTLRAQLNEPVHRVGGEIEVTL